MINRKVSLYTTLELFLRSKFTIYPTSSYILTELYSRKKQKANSTSPKKKFVKKLETDLFVAWKILLCHLKILPPWRRYFFAPFLRMSMRIGKILLDFLYNFHYSFSYLFLTVFFTLSLCEL
jgi:hypothetical protein